MMRFAKGTEFLLIRKSFKKWGCSQGECYGQINNANILAGQGCLFVSPSIHTFDLFSPHFGANWTAFAKNCYDLLSCILGLRDN